MVCTRAAPANRHFGDGPDMTLRQDVLGASTVAGLPLRVVNAVAQIVEPLCDITGRGLIGGVRIWGS